MGTLGGTFWNKVVGTLGTLGTLQEPWEPCGNLAGTLWGKVVGTLWNKVVGTLWNKTVGTLWERWSKAVGTLGEPCGTNLWEPWEPCRNLGNLVGTLEPVGTLWECLWELLRLAPKPLLWLKTPKHAAVGE